MEFETRTQLQDFAEGRDGEIAIFGCESEFGFFLGLEHNGFITYIHPFADTEAFVFSACNFLDETLSALCEISTPRIEILKQLHTLALRSFSGQHIVGNPERLKLFCNNVKHRGELREQKYLMTRHDR